MSANAPSTPNADKTNLPDATKTAQDVGKIIPDSAGLLDKPGLGISKEAAEQTAGSLKVHVKIALEIDIRITARIKGDIAIGIL